MNDIALRILLSAVVVICGGFAGRTLARVDMRRARLLAETMDSMQLLRIHMLDSLMPLGTALSRSQGYILRGTGELMGEMGAAQAWHEFSCRQTARGGRLDSLTQDDCAALDRFFFCLGRTSGEEQRQTFDSVIKELGVLESAARSSGERKHRLYTSLGALAGLSLVIALA